ncbi:MAG: hypothetical protein AAF125_03315, partial [Chloroflexota bacterium]
KRMFNKISSQLRRRKGTRVLEQRVVNLSEAGDYVSKIEDPFLRDILGRAMAAAWVRLTAMQIPPEEDVKPSAPFDMLFYIHVQEDIFRNKRMLKQYLNDEITEDHFIDESLL